MNKTKRMMKLPMAKWGKDHASLLVYVETRAVDYAGKLNHKHLRDNGEDYPTIAKNGEIPGHSDYNCLDDLEDMELITNKGTGMHPVIELTDLGWIIAHALRRHVADGKSYKTFDWEKTWRQV